MVLESSTQAPVDESEKDARMGRPLRFQGAWFKIAPVASFDQPGRQEDYCSSLVTSCCMLLACARAEIPVCDRISYFDMFEVAEA